MGMTKDMWIDAQEAVCEDYQAGTLDFEEAVSALVRLGFDPPEAETLLKEQYS